MDGSALGAVAQWVATACVAGGLVYTWRHNNNEQNQSDIKLKIELKAEIATVTKRLDDPLEGLGAIKREINGVKQNCAAVTSGCSERFKHVEEDVHKLERGKQ